MFANSARVVLFQVGCRELEIAGVEAAYSIGVAGASDFAGVRFLGREQCGAREATSRGLVAWYLLNIEEN